MDERDMETYVAQVVDSAERTFGAEADPALLESYAREAVLDLWLTKARVTVYVAELALNQVREEIARRAGADAKRTARAA
jgi:hypothetical protein